MRIYGQTEEIIVREMTENDCGIFRGLMTEHKTNADFTVEDVKCVWEFRKMKGDVQCTATSIDGKTIYGFCGIVHSEACVSIFNKYSDKGFKEQALYTIEQIK